MTLTRLAAGLSCLLCAVPSGFGQQPSYQGLGADSVAPELIAKYAPPALEPVVSHRIQQMLDLRPPGLGRVTPDGQHLYFGWRITGVAQVFKLSAPQGFPVEMTGGEDATTLQGMTPDGESLVISRDAGGEENPGLYLQSADGGALRTIQKLPKVRTLFDFVSDDGRSVYFHANDVSADSYAIYQYDIASGVKTLVFGGKGLWAVADHRGRGAELRLLLVRETGNFSREYAEYVPADQKFLPLLGVGEAVEYDARYGAQPGELLVRTNKFSDFRRLYRWSMGADATEKSFRPVLAPQGMDVSDFVVDDARSHVYATVNDGGYSRLHVLDARSYAETPIPVPAGADHVSVGSTTPDGRFVSIGVETAQAPRTGYVWDWQKRVLTQWVLTSTPELAPSSFAAAKLMHYPAKDGTPIPAFVRFPKGCAPGENPDADPCPVVVEFHGGPESQAVPGFSPYAQLFVDAGFVFVEPNVRGSDGYGRAWLDADNGPKRLNIISDIDQAGRWARATFGRHGKSPRVGVAGGSYGGYSTLVAMTMFAGTYDAGASVVGMSNLATFLRNTAPYRRILRITEYGDPDKDAEALRKLSPVTYLDRVRAPLLLIQGVNDPRVPAGEAIQIHDLLEKRGIAAPLILFADEGHGAQKRGNIVLQLGHMLQFLQEHLR